MSYELVEGDCAKVMEKMEDDSVDSIVTDPPYGLSFMAKQWDYDVPSTETWKEAFRVLRPGGHLLAFSGSRTYHRMVVNIEDAGFEIRDQIMWLYGEGFPKSHNVANGWGTALKPAHEPIVVARKPLIGTVAENVLEHGTGAMNIDGCRVTTNGERPKGSGKRSIPIVGDQRTGAALGMYGPGGNDGNETPEAGRWPANIILDEEAGAMLGDESRFFYCPKANQTERNKGCEKLPLKTNLNATYGMQSDEGLEWNGRNPENRTREQRNNHPTVKPVDLMKYLCRLVTSPGGVVLDPFMGSGTTGIAACVEGFDFIGIEMEADYIEIARHRIETWVEEKEEQVREERAQKSIFDW